MAGVAQHRFRLLTSDGQALRDIERIHLFEYVRVINDIGWFRLVLPPDYPQEFVDVDLLIEIWREPVGAIEQLMMVGFMRKWRYAKDNRGTELLTVSGPDQVDLLNRAIIGFFAGSSESEKTDLADDMIKEIVFENKGAGAGLTAEGRFRGYDPDHFTVAPDLGQAPSVDRAFAWRRVLPVIQEIADSSRRLGTPLYFDNVPLAEPSVFQFRTTINQLGIDRSSTGIAPLVFSEAAGNLARPSLEEDWTEEWNYVYGGGQGEEANRLIDTENDLSRILRSIWNRREEFQDAREQSTALGVASKAFQKMEQSRPRLNFTGDLLDTPAARYGAEWNFGDRVSARYRGQEFDGLVQRVSVRGDRDGQEILSARLEVDDVTG